MIGDRFSEIHAYLSTESTFYASLAAEFNVTLKDKKHSSGKSTEDKWVDCIGGLSHSCYLKGIEYLSKVVIG